MGMTLGDLFVKIRGDTYDIDKSLADTENKSQSFASKLSAGLGSAVKIGLAGAVGGITSVGVAMAGSITAANDWAGQLDSLGDVLGTNAEDSAALAVAIKGVGGDVDAITGQMAKLTQGLTDEEGGLGNTGKLLKELGVSAFEANGQVVDLNTAISPKDFAAMSDDVAKANEKLKKMEEAVRNAKNPTDDMTKAVEAQNLEVANMEKALGKAHSQVVNLNEAGMRPASEIIQEVANKISHLPDGLEKSRLMMDLFGKSGKDMTDTLNALTTEGLEKAGQKAKDFGLSLSDDAVAASVETSKKLKDLEMMLGGVAIKIGGELLPKLLPMVGKFVEFASNVLPKVITALQPVMDTLFKVAEDVVPQVMQAFTDISAWLTTNWPKIQPVIVDVFNALIAIWNDPLKPILGFLLQILGEIVGFMLDHWPEISASFKAEIDKVVVVWNTILKPALTAILTAFAAIVEWVTINFPRIKTDVETTILAVSTTIDTVITTIRTGWETAWQSLQDTLGTAITSITDSITKLPDKFLNFGRQLMEGLINGVKQNIETLKKSLFGWLPDWAKSALGISSPSTLFMGYGQQIMRGLAIGIRQTTDLPRAALSEAVRSLTGFANLTSPSLSLLGAGATPSMAGAGGVVGTSPTINVYATINNGMDAELLAYKIAKRLS